LESLVSKLEIRDYVSFMNYVAHPFETMCEFDVFVLPSIRNEDFPYVILESMVLGKPVIGTLVAGIPEQIENQVSGLLVEPNNPLELAKAMCASMEDEFTSNCGVNAKAKYFNEFSYDKVEGMYFDLFRNFN
jgi:glycosyltransferase involved in cell wall biosynthesis